MTEIKAVDYKAFWKRSTMEIITYTEGSLADIIQLARKDILSLITTIESQKEEIKALREACIEFTHVHFRREPMSPSIYDPAYKMAVTALLPMQEGEN